MLRAEQPKSVGELEAEVSQAIIRFEKEFMGRGPLGAKSLIVDDLVVVRLKGVLTPSELKLAESADKQRGRYLLKQVRHELMEHGRPLLEAVIRDILGVAVKSLHADISTKTGERIIVFTLDEQPIVSRGIERNGNHAAESSKLGSKPCQAVHEDSLG